MSVLPIYLDFNATTPADPRVVEAMLPYFTGHFGNPSSKRHAYGWAADEAVASAREGVAALVNAEPADVIFTSGATEALNLAIRGIAAASLGRGRHIVSVATEHLAVLEPYETLRRAGFDVDVLPVDREGRIDLDLLNATLRADTTLVSIMWANNETGVIHDMERIAQITRSHSVPLLSDATQAVGKIPVDVSMCDLLALSAHKFYGPKGIGALIRKPSTSRMRIIPQIEGGGQEGGLRGGTLNVPGIVGMGRAARVVVEQLHDDGQRLKELRDRFEAGLATRLSDTEFFGYRTDRLPNTSNFAVRGIPSERIIAGARGLAMSTGSACGSGAGRRSHVIAAMRPDADPAPTTIRVSVGRSTTEAEIDAAVRELTHAVEAEAPELVRIEYQK
jgi:cysteine desulfurase